MDQLKEELAAILEGEVEDDDKTLARYSRDASIFEIKPRIVVSPKNATDLKKLIGFASAHKKLKLSFAPWSGGTDMSGGPLTESVVLDMKRHFNKIKHVGLESAIAEPGVYYRDFERATLEHGRLMPAYPSSREICTIGGMVANNAGGEKTLTYGKSDQYVTQLKVVLADGNEYTIKPLTKSELDKKMAHKTFEGELYRRVFKIVETHHEELQKAKPKVSKNSAGYYLWDIWDGQSFDLTKLFVGSQGSLGIITEITYRLIKPKQHSKMLVIFLRDLKSLAKIVNHVLEFKPESFESFDHQTLRLAITFLPDMTRIIKSKNIIHAMYQFLPEFIFALFGGLPKLVLIAEFTGDSQRDVNHRAKEAQKSLEYLRPTSFLTRNKSESRKYWAIRRESFNLLRRHTEGHHTAPFIDDIIVTPSQLPEFMPELDAIMSDYKLIYTLAGHIGDANFHIIPLMDFTDPAVKKIIPELSSRVFELVFRYGGSMSGEHNDGLVRTPYLEAMYGKTICRLFQEVKHIFDPHLIFNPGKKVGATLSYGQDRLLQANYDQKQAS